MSRGVVYVDFAKSTSHYVIALKIHKVYLGGAIRRAEMINFSGRIIIILMLADIVGYVDWMNYFFIFEKIN